MMRLIRCLFFLEAWFCFDIVAAHLPGRENMLADDLSRNRLSDFLSKAQSPDPRPAAGVTRTAPGPRRLDISTLDQALFHYCNSSVANTTRTYRSGLNRFLSFYFAFGVPSLFPVSETLLCYFVTALAWEGIAPATIWTYVS